MNRFSAPAKMMIVGLLSFSGLPARTQVAPSARQPLALSVFGGLTGTYTGLGGGRNLGITAGADLDFHPIFHLVPSAEIRGTYPIKDGQVDDQRNILGGVRDSFHFRRLHPYANLLFGRGGIDYVHGYPDPTHTFDYLSSSSFVISPGGGADLRITTHLAVKGDVQFQRYAVPVAGSGHIYAKPLTLAVVYRFDRNH